LKPIDALVEVACALLQPVTAVDVPPLLVEPPYRLGRACHGNLGQLEVRVELERLVPNTLDRAVQHLDLAGSDLVSHPKLTTS
jgi:hypothetical protein